MRNVLFILLAFVSLAFVVQNDKPAYQLYTKTGKKTTYAKMLHELTSADVILFGEYHDNPIAHWLQLEVTTDIGKKAPLVLGAEMFEADNQQQMNEFLLSTDPKQTMEQIDGFRLWPNNTTDYLPLVELAKKNKWPFIATNIPRKYASQVYHHGLESLDTLSDDEKKWIAPLPIAYDPELPGYKAMLEMMGGHGGDNFPKAQAIKDATMAHFIVANRDNKLFVHYNGSYHSDNFEGIGWYLKKYDSNLKVVTIATVSQENLAKLEGENKGKADYVITVTANMTSTH